MLVRLRAELELRVEVLKRELKVLRMLRPSPWLW